MNRDRVSIPQQAYGLEGQGSAEPSQVETRSRRIAGAVDGERPARQTPKEPRITEAYLRSVEQDRNHWHRGDGARHVAAHANCSTSSRPGDCRLKLESAGDGGRVRPFIN